MIRLKRTLTLCIAVAAIAALCVPSIAAASTQTKYADTETFGSNGLNTGYRHATSFLVRDYHNVYHPLDWMEMAYEASGGGYYGDHSFYYNPEYWGSSGPARRPWCWNLEFFPVGPITCVTTAP